MFLPLNGVVIRQLKGVYKEIKAINMLNLMPDWFERFGPALRQTSETKIRPTIMKTKLPRTGWGHFISVAAVTFASYNVFAASELQTPFRIEANGKPIDMQIGFAAPYFADFDGDGKFDLLVGQRGECKLRIFRNLGSREAPRFGPSAFFKAGGVDASLPGG